MKKTLYLIILVLCTGLLVGFGKKIVDLRDNKPLIDLNKAIHEAPIGQEGNEGAVDNETEEEYKDDFAEVNENHVVVTPTNILSIYKVSIRNTTIKYGDLDCVDAQELKEKLQQEYKIGDKVILVDDYAESHVYKEVLAVLDELVQTIGLEYGEQ